MSTLLVVGGGKELGVMDAAASVWPTSWLVEGAAPLARAKVVVKFTIRILSTSSTGSCHDGSCGQAAAVVCLLTSLFRRCTISCSALGRATAGGRGSVGARGGRSATISGGPGGCAGGHIVGGGHPPIPPFRLGVQKKKKASPVMIGQFEP
jgi:hypothetical protein